MKPQEHFSKHSNNYDQQRDHGILGRIVRKEQSIVLKNLNVQKGETILDAGAGSGSYSLLIKQQEGKPYALDISLDMIRHLHERGLQGEVADLEDFSLKKKFDKILCAGALEFLNNPDKTLRLFHTHLKENGTLVILYPRYSACVVIYTLYHLLHGISITLFSKKKISSLLTRNGFKILNQEKASVNCAVITAIKQQPL